VRAWLAAFVAATPDQAKHAPAIVEAAVTLLTERKIDRETQSTVESIDVTRAARAAPADPRSRAAAAAR
jgi:hypothetical protein